MYTVALHSMQRRRVGNPLNHCRHRVELRRSPPTLLVFSSRNIRPLHLRQSSNYIKALQLKSAIQQSRRLPTLCLTFAAEMPAHTGAMTVHDPRGLCAFERNKRMPRRACDEDFTSYLQSRRGPVTTLPRSHVDTRLKPLSFPGKPITGSGD